VKYFASGKQTVYPEDYKTKVEFLRKSQEWLKRKEAEGIVESAYSFTAGGGFIVFDVSSHNELVENLIDFPMYCLCEFTVQPLVTFHDNADFIINEFRKCGAYREENPDEYLSHCVYA